MPLLRSYDPDFVVLELGMDILAGDPLTHLHMTNNVVVDVIQRVLGLNRPLLIVGGGGYHVENTVRGWALAWRTCGGDDAHDEFSLGLGGEMLGSTEWAGGLRDHRLPVTDDQRLAVEPFLEESIRRLMDALSPYHKLGSPESPDGKAEAQH